MRIEPTDKFVGIATAKGGPMNGQPTTMGLYARRGADGNYMLMVGDVPKGTTLEPKFTFAANEGCRTLRGMLVAKPEFERGPGGGYVLHAGAHRPIGTVVTVEGRTELGLR